MKIRKEYIKFFIICMFLLLNIAIYLNGKQLNPDKCVITFKSARAGQDWDQASQFNISIKLTELHENLQNGKCRVEWTRTQGYRLA